MNWKRYCKYFWKLARHYQSQKDLHRFLDQLGVDRSAYGWKSVCDGSYARISTMMGRLRALESGKPVVQKKDFDVVAEQRNYYAKLSDELRTKLEAYEPRDKAAETA